MTSGADTPRLSPLTSPLLGQARHGFFTREGGVSTGPYASLNCSMRSGDTHENLMENRRRVAGHFGVLPDSLLGVTQVHGAEVINAQAAWPPGSGTQADALVTDRPELAISVITADCAPVLFSTADGAIVGAAHAGWRGALAGVLEAALAAMLHMGAEASSVHAVVGPCIAQESYETAEDMHSAVLAGDRQAATFFTPGHHAGRYQFDLAGWCVFRLQRAGIGRAVTLGMDTLPDTQRFFSHRRRTLAGGGPIGHQISAIAPRRTA